MPAPVHAEGRHMVHHVAPPPPPADSVNGFRREFAGDGSTHSAGPGIDSSTPGTLL